MFHITRFAENLFASLRRITRGHLVPTFATASLVESSCISELHEFPISLSWMSFWKRNTDFYVKCQFWSNNLKWFTCDRAAKHCF